MNPPPPVRTTRIEPRPSRRPRPPEQPRYGPDEDAKVPEQRSGLYVPDIEPVHVEEAQRAATAHLPEASDARLHDEPRADPVGILGEGIRDVRARADEAHLASQHVPQLRELIKARPPQERADTRDPRVAGHLVDRAARLLTHQAADERRVRLRIRVGAHRAELRHTERAPEAADPLG